MRLSFAAVVTLALFALGCGSGPDDPEEPIAQLSEAVAAPLGGAFCTAQVTGKGGKATEDDYLPHVITCENGGANLEALKAQAIAARSVLYYNMATSGSICDGQGCQVYSCGAAPQAKHYQAVKETAGMYLSYAGTLTYGFYVAGDSNASPPSCKDYGGSTTKYVTYNEGKTGTSVQQTTLGYVGPPGFGQNRGCMGQWGARCLENHNGYGYMDILRFYYGADIQVLKATGPCTQGCEPTHCNGSKIVSACGEGDCAAYGATCVDDSKGVRCASVFCPAQGYAKVCVNEKLIGDCNDGAISTGDCSAYGATCVDDELGARCVSPLCPAKGEDTVCVDDAQILDCKDGAHVGTGDCSVYGAYCSSAGAEKARCVSVFCVGSPDEVPTAKDVCLPNGQLAHCAADGAITAEDCPAADPCAQNEYGAACGTAPSGPPPGSGGSSGTGSGGNGGTSSGSGGTGDSGGSAGTSPAKPGDRGEVLGDESGCACRAGGSGAPSGAGWAAILALGFALGRRRAGGTGRA